MRAKEKFYHFIGFFWPINYNPKEVVEISVVPPEKKDWWGKIIYQFIGPFGIIFALINLAYLTVTGDMHIGLVKIFITISTIITLLISFFEEKGVKKLKAEGKVIKDRFEGREWYLLGALLLGLFIIFIIKMIINLS